MESRTQLAQLLCTRLCHDLAGPVGAVAAGVELVGDDPAAVDQETLELIAASSDAASRKLKFLRTAFGTAAQMSSAALAELESTVRGYFEAVAGPSGAIAVSWPAVADLARLQERASPGAVQVLLNALLVAAEASPKSRGLQVAVSHPEDPIIAIAIQAEVSGGNAPRTDIIDLVADPSGTLPSARTAQALYWLELAHSVGAVATVTFEGGAMTALVSFAPISSLNSGESRSRPHTSG
jgi:histidine phosphotransferase ChpT